MRIYTKNIPGWGDAIYGEGVELRDDSTNILECYAGTLTDDTSQLGLRLAVMLAEPLTASERRAGALEGWVALASVWLELADAESLVAGLTAAIRDVRDGAFAQRAEALVAGARANDD
jgi:hypothetical protein